MPLWIYAEDLAPGLVGPFDTTDDAVRHIQFCEARGDADPGRVVTQDEVDVIKKLMPGVHQMTPERDREMNV